METLRSENIKMINIAYDILDVAKAESLIEGKTVQKLHFGYSTESTMLFSDFVRALLHEAVKEVKVTPKIKKRVMELQAKTRKSNQYHIQYAMKKMEKKVESMRARYSQTCLTSLDAAQADPMKKCYDPAKRTILLPKGNWAQGEVVVSVNETGAKSRKFVLVPLTEEWRDKLLTVKNGKVVGHADRIHVKFPGNGEEWVWDIRDVRVANITYSFRTFSDTGAVPPKGIVPTYFAVMFKGRRRVAMPWTPEGGMKKKKR